MPPPPLPTLLSTCTHPRPRPTPTHPRRAIVPIGACYAITLWVGNSAYLYLSVSFIQMLKVGGGG